MFRRDAVQRSETSKLPGIGSLLFRETWVIPQKQGSRRQMFRVLGMQLQGFELCLFGV